MNVKDLESPAEPRRKPPAPRLRTRSKSRASTTPDPRPQKLAEKVAERIIADIVERGWPVNENFGTEPELLVRYGISRATFREANRQLERHGVAKMRRGANGGLFVCDPPRAAAERSMLSFFEITGLTFADQHETREQLEALAASLAAVRIDDEDRETLKRLRLRLPQVNSFGAGVDIIMEVRLAIARATKNPALVLFTEVLNGALLEMLRNIRIDEDALRNSEYRAVDQKDRLIGAILNGNAGEAKRIVHLDAHQRLLAMTSAVARPRSIAKPSEFADSLPPWWENNLPALKLNDQIVYRIVDDIAKFGWKEGHNLGREVELQKMYGVSRSTLREAIRQLELHGIARMKTGLQGGLIMSRIDPTYTVKLATTYLKSTKISIIHFWETQSCLAEFAASRLAQIADGADREALQVALDRLRRADSGNYLDVAGDLQMEISTRTGNRALSLFSSILYRRFMELCPPISGDAQPWLVDKLERIVAAISERDSVRAKEEMAHLFRRTQTWFVENLP